MFVPEVHLVALPIAAIYHALFVRGAALPRIRVVLLEAASGTEHACPGAARGLFYLWRRRLVDANARPSLTIAARIPGDTPGDDVPVKPYSRMNRVTSVTRRGTGCGAGQRRRWVMAQASTKRTVKRMHKLC